MESDATSVLNKNKKLEYIIDYCRVCMCRQDGGNMISIFDSQGQDYNIVGRIQFCTGVEFKKEDGLPTHICNNCTQHLTVAHKFKTSCLESEDVFRKILQECIKDEPEDLNDFINNYDCGDESKSMELKDEIENERKSMDYEDEVLKKVSNENVIKSIDFANVVLENVSNENVRKSMEFQDEVENVRKSEDCEYEVLKNVSNVNVIKSMNFANEVLENVTNENVIQTMDFVNEVFENITNGNVRKSMDFEDEVSNENVRKSMEFEDKVLDKVSTENLRKSMDFEAEVLKKVSTENVRVTRARVKKKNDSMVENEIENLTGIKIQKAKERPKILQDPHKNITIEKTTENQIENITRIKIQKEKDRPKVIRGPHKKSKPTKIKTSKVHLLKCELCNMKFKSKAESAEHKKMMHKNERSITCEVCGKVFMERNTRDMHMSTHQPPKYECAHCDYKTRRKRDLVSHIARRHGVKRYQCELCAQSYCNNAELSNHTRTIHEGMKKFQCDLCDKQFALRSSLNRHNKKSHGGKRTINLENEKITEKKTVKNIDKSSVCEVCGKVLSTEAIYKVHMFTHQLPKLECDHCDYKACQKYEMVSHMRRHGGSKRFPCELCSRSFFIKAILNTHIRACHGVKKFQCDICDKRFSLKSRLVKHTKTHEEKQHECEVCHRRFLTRYYWRIHLKQHHGVEVPKLNSRGINRKHRSQALSDDTDAITKSAEGKKLYQCEFCPRSYHTFKHLDCHIVSCHEDVVKPKCNVCDKQFANRIILKRHMDTHDKFKRVECEICHNTFSRRAFWRLHLQRQHGLKTPDPRPGRPGLPEMTQSENTGGVIAKSHAKQTHRKLAHKS